MSGCDNFDFEAPQDEFAFMDGLRGADGTTFYPHVSAEGVLSWTNDGGKPNPAPVNIKGADGKSAYAAAQEAGFTGTEAEFNAYLSGIGDLTEEVAQHQTAINDLTALVDRKAGALIDTASGAIASFVPDSTIPDLLGVTVDVEPVQDLHGYDSPWPAGGGKNQAFDVRYTNASSQYQPAILATYKIKAGKRYIFSFMTANTGQGVYRQSPENLGFSGFSAYAFTCDGNRKSFYGTATTDTEKNASIILKLENNSDPVGMCYDFMIEEVDDTTTTPSNYAPYSNDCPISGWDAVRIEAAGRNLVDISGAEIGTAWNGSQTTARARLVVPIKHNTQYILTMNGTNSLDGVYSELSTTVPPSDINRRTFPYSFNSGENDYLVLGFNKTAISQTDVDALKLQLEPGSQATAFKPYQGNTYTITLGQTVYGGILDVTGGTMTAGKADQNVSAFTSEYGSAGPSGWRRFRFNTAASIPFVGHGYTIGAICDKLQEMNANALAAIVNNGTITAPAFSAVSATEICVALPVTTLADANAYLTSLGGLQFVYPLATPITIQLDPVTIAAIAGQTNNVWADAGDVSVEFAADLNQYIDSKIAAAVAALS